MRKLFMVFMVFLLAATMAQAQDETETFIGPSSGDLLIEITGTPFEGSSILNFGSFRARYIIRDTFVPRVSANMSINATQSTPDKVTTLSEYTVAPGLEYHLQRSRGFRSYIAADLIFGQRFASAESTTGQAIDGSTQVPSGNNYSFSESLRGHTQYGGQLAFGADYHFSSRIYIGVEIGFQFVHSKKNEVKVDGQMYQAETVYNYGSINTNNSFRVGFKLL